ncbi:ANTAR domain-containing protein [Jiangella ureilytica]|uniref:ANTAR domain-containing protein n=2 Tax=Jiangella ureilytica TaxID=2530374 RepID=A0A4R4RLI9_9ACTN|nr:ANTAR domain-containing protein [Jiangella ureilytica]
MSGEDTAQPTLATGPPTFFERELASLRAQIDRLGGDGAAVEGQPDLRLQYLADLQTAHEELRVADEEVRAQQEELERLVSTQQSTRWQYERLIALLPVAAVVTDGQGLITVVNAVAAGLLGVRIDRLLRKPLQVLIEPQSRSQVRRALNDELVPGQLIQESVRIRTRRGELIAVELLGTVTASGTAGETEVTWLVLDGEAGMLPRHEESTTRLATGLVQLTQLPLHAGRVRDILHSAAHICAVALGDDTAVSVTLGPPAEPDAVATTTKLAQSLDGAQTMAAQGPSQSAWDELRTVTAADLASDPRWPILSRLATDLEARALVATPLTVGGVPFGTLNVYAPAAMSDHEFATRVETLGAAMAAVLHELELRHELQVNALHLQRALQSRPTIDIAKGMIMTARRCSPDEAFEAMVRMSKRTNTKVRDVAARIVADVTLGRQLKLE